MVTAQQRHEANKASKTQPYVIFVDVQEDYFDYVHRACTNNESLDFDGETYAESDLKVSLPKSGEGETEATAEISNVTLIPGQALYRARNRIGVRLRVVDMRNPTQVVKVDTKNALIMGQREITPMKIRTTLKPRASLINPWPPNRAERFLPGTNFDG